MASQEINETFIYSLIKSPEKGKSSAWIKAYQQVESFSKTVDGLNFFLNSLVLFSDDDCLQYSFGKVRQWLINNFLLIPTEFHSVLIDVLFVKIVQHQIFLQPNYRATIIKFHSIVVYQLYNEYFSNFWTQYISNQSDAYFFDFLKEFSYIFDEDNFEKNKNGRDHQLSILNALLADGSQENIISSILIKIPENNDLAIQAFKEVIKWISLSLLIKQEIIQLLLNIFGHVRFTSFVLDTFTILFQRSISLDIKLELLNAIQIPNRLESLMKSETITKEIFISFSKFIKSVVCDFIETEVGKSFVPAVFMCFECLDSNVFYNIKHFFFKLVKIDPEICQNLTNSILSAMTNSIVNETFDTAVILHHCFSMLAAISKIAPKNCFCQYLVQLMSSIGDIYQCMPQTAALLTALRDFLENADHRDTNIDASVLPLFEPLLWPTQITPAYCIALGSYSTLVLPFLNEVPPSFIQNIFTALSKSLLAMNEIPKIKGDSLSVSYIEESIVAILKEFPVLILQIPEIDKLLLTFITMPNSPYPQMVKCATKLIRKIDNPPDLRFTVFSNCLNFFISNLAQGISISSFLLFVNEIDAYNCEPLSVQLISLLTSLKNGNYIPERNKIQFIKACLRSLHYISLPLIFDEITSRPIPETFKAVSVIDYYVISLNNGDIQQVMNIDALLIILNFILSNQKKLFCGLKLSKSTCEEYIEKIEVFRSVTLFIIQSLGILIKNNSNNSPNILEIVNIVLDFINKAIKSFALDENNIKSVCDVFFYILNENNFSIIADSVFSTISTAMQQLKTKKFVKESKIHIELLSSVAKRCVEIQPDSLEYLVRGFAQSGLSESETIEFVKIIKGDVVNFFDLFKLLETK